MENAFDDGLWLFAILALFGLGGNGGLFGNGNQRAATVEDLANQSNFTRLEGQITANGQAIAQGFTNIGNGISSLGYEMATQFGNANMIAKECCCETNRNIDSVKYDNLLQSCGIVEKLGAKIDGIGALIYQNKIEALQNEVNGLRLNSALCGVVRYPNAMTYNAGFSPFCANTCVNSF